LFLLNGGLAAAPGNGISSPIVKARSSRHN
jgi:hypothetical protein